MPPSPLPRPGTKKRKRSSSMSASSSPSSSASSTAFGETEMQPSEPSCLACGSVTMLDAVHVMQEHDSSLRLLRERGLVNFDINSTENEVALCGNCHGAHNEDDPGFIFWPSDLDFFITTEVEYRMTPPENRPVYRFPSAREYASHQRRRQGLYDRVFLKLYLSPFAGKDLTTLNSRLGPPVPWHGAPFASLRRAFKIIGSPHINPIPLDVENKLITLKNLYYRDNFQAYVLAMPIPSNDVVIEDGTKILSTSKGLEQSTSGKNHGLTNVEREEE